MTTLLFVMIGGALGAPARYLIDLWVQSRHKSVFPFGTLAVNVLGSLILGCTAGALTTSGSTWVMPLVGIGFCGALTTFSTFGFETVRLVQEGALRESASNVVASVALSLAACAGGWSLVAAAV